MCTNLNISMKLFDVIQVNKWGIYIEISFS